MSKLSKKIQPVSRVDARIRLPGSKSVTHRALLMAALADSPSDIKNPLVAEDTLLTAKALEQLGARAAGKQALLVKHLAAAQRVLEFAPRAAALKNQQPALISPPSVPGIAPWLEPPAEGDE